MKKNIFHMMAAGMLIALAACSRASGGADSVNAWNAPTTINTSINEYDLIADENRVGYTIDNSTPEGKTKLKGISLQQAQELALVEATVKYNCDMLLNPQYTHLKKGKKILRVTVSGRPARYKNQPAGAITKVEQTAITTRRQNSATTQQQTKVQVRTRKKGSRR